MPLTLAVGLCPLEAGEVRDCEALVKSSAEESGYEASFGLGGCSSRVKPGLAEWMETQDVASVVMIHGADEADGEAGEIMDGLLGISDKAVPMRFFGRVLAVCKAARVNPSFAFVVESWGKEEAFRMESGEASSFLDYLSRPSGPWIAYCHMGTNTVSIDDQSPCVFTVRFRF